MCNVSFAAMLLHVINYNRFDNKMPLANLPKIFVLFFTQSLISKPHFAIKAINMSFCLLSIFRVKTFRHIFCFLCNALACRASHFCREMRFCLHLTRESDAKMIFSLYSGIWKNCIKNIGYTDSFQFSASRASLKLGANSRIKSSASGMCISWISKRMVSCARVNSSLPKPPSSTHLI